MPKLSNILIWCWLLIWVVIGILILKETPQIIKKHESSIKVWFKPSIDFIEHFKESNKRLPTKLEFNRWSYQGEVLPIEPNVYIEDFKTKNNRNPTEQEYLDWELNQKKVIYSERQLDSISKTDGQLFLIRSNIDASDKYKAKHINWDNEYILGSIDEEDEETFYYQSWDKFNTYSWNWIEGFKGFGIYILIGLSPQLLKGIFGLGNKIIVIRSFEK